MPSVSLSGTSEHSYNTTWPDPDKQAPFFSLLQHAATFFLSSYHDLYSFVSRARYCSFCCLLLCLFFSPYLHLLFFLFLLPYINSFPPDLSGLHSLTCSLCSLFLSFSPLCLFLLPSFPYSLLWPLRPPGSVLWPQPRWYRLPLLLLPVLPSRLPPPPLPPPVLHSAQWDNPNIFLSFLDFKDIIIKTIDKKIRPI